MKLEIIKSTAVAFGMLLIVALVSGVFSKFRLLRNPINSVATILYMLNWVELVTITYFALNIPTALLELTLAGYLIWGCFRPASFSTPQTRLNNTNVRVYMNNT